MLYFLFFLPWNLSEAVFNHKTELLTYFEHVYPTLVCQQDMKLGKFALALTKYDCTSIVSIKLL